MSQPHSNQADTPLRISYLFPQFPKPTEVFAISDILALRAEGHQVVVHTIKPARSDEADRLRLCDVPRDLLIRRPSVGSAFRWPMLMWKMRAPATYLFGRIIRNALRSPATALTALLSIPRVVEIAEEIRELDADVVHVFWSRHPGMVLAVLGLQGDRAKRSAFVGAYDLIADDFLVDLTIGWSEVVFSHSEANRAYLEQKVPHNIPAHIVHRGIPLVAPDENLVRDANLWITASSLTPTKNVEGVLKAFAQARRSRRELALVIYGEGEDRSRLEQCSRDLGCSDAVRFGGHVRREELFRNMQGAAVFLLLSKKASERLPNVVKEALWAGCAIISSNSEGIEALMPDESIGHVIDPDDASAVDAAIQNVLAETSEQACLRRSRARELIAASFSSDGGMREYVAAWRGIGADEKGQLSRRASFYNVA